MVAVDSGSGIAPNVNRSTEQVFTITINAVNDAPVFTPGANVECERRQPALLGGLGDEHRTSSGILQTPQTALDENNPPQPVDFTISVDRPSLFSVQPTISSSGQLQFTLARDAFGTR